MIAGTVEFDWEDRPIHDHLDKRPWHHFGNLIGSHRVSPLRDGATEGGPEAGLLRNQIRRCMNGSASGH